MTIIIIIIVVYALTLLVGCKLKPTTKNNTLELTPYAGNSFEQSKHISPVSKRITLRGGK